MFNKKKYFSSKQNGVFVPIRCMQMLYKLSKAFLDSNDKEHGLSSFYVQEIFLAIMTKHNGGQIIRLLPTENMLIATEPLSTAYRIIIIKKWNK